jgi:copper(I)-binding protein
MKDFPIASSNAPLYPRLSRFSLGPPMRFALFSLTVAAGALGAIPSAAAPVAAGIQATGAWSRPVPAGLPTGAVYLTLTNLGSKPDRLMDAETPVAARMTLHLSTMVHGMMSMAPVPGGLEIAPGGVVKIAPGGYHFMLEGLKGGLQAGARFPAILTFAHAGRVRIEVQVRPGPMAGGGGMTMR